MFRPTPVFFAAIPVVYSSCFFLFREYLHDLLFFPQLSVPLKKTKKTWTAEKTGHWSLSHHGAESLENGRSEHSNCRGSWTPTNLVTRGTIAAASVLNEVEKMTSWQVQHGVTMEGACWGFKKTCLFFYLSCFKFALVRIWSQNLPVKIGHSLFFFLGKSVCKVTNQNLMQGNFTGRWIPRYKQLTQADWRKVKKRHP